MVGNENISFHKYNIISVQNKENIRYYIQVSLHINHPPPLYFPLYSKSYIFVLFAQLYQGLWQGVSDILHPLDLSLSQNIKHQLTCTQRNEAWIIHCTGYINT